MDAQDPEHIVCCNCGYAINIALDGKREALTHSLTAISISLVCHVCIPLACECQLLCQIVCVT